MVFVFFVVVVVAVVVVGKGFVKNPLKSPGRILGGSGPAPLKAMPWGLKRGIRILWDHRHQKRDGFHFPPSCAPAAEILPESRVIIAGNPRGMLKRAPHSSPSPSY